jgi:hypothetical protein
MANRANLGVDRILSRYTLLLKNRPNMFVADRALPQAVVNHPRGSFYTVDPGMAYASPGYGMLRTSGADFRRITTDVSQSSLYTLAEYGISAPVDDVDAAFAGSDALDLRQAATEIAWNAAMIERERDFAALLFSTATFSSYTAALSGTDRWDNASSSPLTQADAAAESVRQNTGVPRSELSLLVGAKVWDSLRKNTALTDFYKNVVAGKTHLDEAAVASALGIKEVIVGSAVGNSAVEGATKSMENLWKKFALFYHKVDAPRPLTPHGVGACFTMAGRQPGRVERFREEPRSEVMLVSWLEDRVVTNASSGYLYSTVIS